MTLTQLNELRAKRVQTIAEGRAILDKAEKEKRELDATESENYERALADADKLNIQIKREERQLALDAEARAATHNSNPERPGRHTETPEFENDADPAERTAAQREMDFRASKKYAAAFRKYITRGRMSLTPDEVRDLSSDSDTDGGYLVAPTQLVTGILKNLDDEVFIRAKARKFTLVKAKSLGAIKRTAKLSTFAWGGEITPPTKDASLKFGKRELFPHYLSGLALVSRDLLLNAMESAESIVNSEIVRDAGEVQEQAFVTGSGSGQPLGVFTASSDGISTARDVSTGNTATTITFDGLIESKFSLKPQYRRTAEWMFHRDAIKMISKIKDNEDRYIWEPSKVVGEPDRILGLPYQESEWVPNTFTSGLYVGILANWQFYWIADALDLQIQRLSELYALSNQDGFVARMKTDGMPQIEEAFARVKLG
jgi:HK97 family phage major capsid protein